MIRRKREKTIIPGKALEKLSNFQVIINNKINITSNYSYEIYFYEVEKIERTRWVTIISLISFLSLAICYSGMSIVNV